MVNTVCELGRQQGGVTDEQGGRNFELAKVVLGGSEGETGARPLEAVDLAAVLKMAGVDLTKVDPNQLQSAAKYVSGAPSLEEQQQKLRKALDNFQVLEKIGLPKMSRQQMVDELWGVAKVPGHALAKLSDAEVSKKFQEVLGTVNAGPGKSEIKVGKYNLKLEVGQNGTVSKSSCKKPGFFSKLVKIAKIVTPIALTVMSFIPITAPFALAAQGVISMVQAIKAKSLLGIATAAASMAGAAGAIVSKFAGAASKVADAASKTTLAAKAATAARVAKVANSASRALQGISSLKSGNVIGGLASIGGAIASGLSTFAGSAAKGLGKFAENLNKFSTKMSAVGTGVASFEGYKRASQAVSAAKEALVAARATGDGRGIAAAEKQLSQAESQKRAAVLGGAVGAASAASAWVENRNLFGDESKATPPAQTALQSKLRLASQGLGVAQSVAAKDYAGAAVAALSFGSTVNSRQKGGKENRLNDAANLAQAGLGYYQAEKGRAGSNQAVSDAQTGLEAAKRGGNAEAIRLAEADLKKAKGAAESALMGGIAAGQSLLGTARDIGDRNRAEKAEKEEKAKRALKVANEGTIAGRKTADRLAALAADPNASPEAREAARAEQADLKAADEKLQKDILAAKGDPVKLAKAIGDFEQVRAAAATREAEIARAVAAAAASAGASASPGFASLRRPQRVGAAQVGPGVTVWAVSQRTGVPVDRILEFNAESGNLLDAKNLQIGQQILVPLDEAPHAASGAAVGIGFGARAWAEGAASNLVSDSKVRIVEYLDVIEGLPGKYEQPPGATLDKLRETAAAANKERNAALEKSRSLLSDEGLTLSEKTKARGPTVDELLKKQKYRDIPLEEALRDIIKSSGRSDPQFSGVARGVAALEKAGKASMVVGVALDSYSLGTEIDRSVQTGNPDYAGREAARIAGGWAGAWAAGEAGAATGAFIGAFTGPAAPVAVPVLSFALGVGGAIIGYWKGSEAGHFYYDAARTPSATK